MWNQFTIRSINGPFYRQRGPRAAVVYLLALIASQSKTPVRCLSWRCGARSPRSFLHLQMPVILCQSAPAYRWPRWLCSDRLDHPNVIFLLLTVERRRFDTSGQPLAVCGDRVQLVIAFSFFWSFFEGASGFGPSCGLTAQSSSARFFPSCSSRLVAACDYGHVADGALGTL